MQSAVSRLNCEIRCPSLIALTRWLSMDAWQGWHKSKMFDVALIALSRDPPARLAFL